MELSAGDSWRSLLVYNILKLTFYSDNINVINNYSITVRNYSKLETKLFLFKKMVQALE
jgi:hypothetical protein